MSPIMIRRTSDFKDIAACAALWSGGRLLQAAPPAPLPSGFAAALHL